MVANPNRKITYRIEVVNNKNRDKYFDTNKQKKYEITYKIVDEHSQIPLAK